MKNVNDLLDKIDEEIRKMDTFKKRYLPFIILLIAFSPIIFTRSWTNFDFSKTGDIGSTIGGITAPFIGLVSAYLVFLSFRVQTNANRLQIEALVIEKNRLQIENDLTFVYHRLNEIKANSENQIHDTSLGAVNGLLQDIDNIFSNQARLELQEESYSDRIIKKKEPLLFVLRQMNLFIISNNKLNELKFDIGETQFDYIKSSLDYEYERKLNIYIVNHYLVFFDNLNKKGNIVNDELVSKLEKNSRVLNDIFNPSA